MRCAGGGDETLRQEPVELCADVGDRLGLCRGRRSGQCDLHLMCGGERLLDPADDVERRRAPARRPPGAAARRTRSGVHTGAGASTATAASAQSSSRAGSEPSGLAPSTRRVRGSSWRSMVLTGDGTDSRSSRRTPGPIAASCSAFVANTRRSTAPPASTNAGKPRTVWPPLTRSTVRGSSSMSSGQPRSPVRSSPSATASATACLAGAASCCCSASRSLPRATSVPSADSTANFTRRWEGSLSRSNASIGTSTPVRRCNARCNDCSSGSVPGSRDGKHRAGGVGCGNEVAAQVFWK